MKGPLRSLVLLQLMPNLHSVFANLYLHEVESDGVLSCETRGIAEKTVEKLQILDVKKFTEVTDALYADGNINTCVKIEDTKKSNENFFYTLTVDTKVTRKKTLKILKKSY